MEGMRAARGDPMSFQAAISTGSSVSATFMRLIWKAQAPGWIAPVSSTEKCHWGVRMQKAVGAKSTWHSEATTFLMYTVRHTAASFL